MAYNRVETNSPILPPELSHFITDFVPSHAPAARSKAYLTLSAFCQGVRSSSVPNGKNPTDALVEAFQPLFLSRLTETEENHLLASVSFLTALFQVDWESASVIFQQDGVLDVVMDSVDLNSSGQLNQCVARLLSQACGHKVSRAALTSQSVRWLEYTSRSTSDTNLRASATTALIKLSKGSAVDRSEALGEASGAEGVPAEGNTRKDEDLANAMKEIVISDSNHTSKSDAVEGLAYLSVDPAIKDVLSRDNTFLRQLFALVPRRKTASSGRDSIESTSTLVYGILVIISNLCAYRPRVTEEEAQIQKLRQMANANKTPNTSSTPSVLDDDENVKTRIRQLVDAGVLDVFGAAVHIDSPGIRLTSGKALLSIVEDQGNRGRVLQCGGAKVLTLIIKHTLPILSSRTSKPLDPVYLDPIQALAKLAITSSPVQVFGPNEGAMYDAIRPLSLMLQGSSSTLLQRFESMMALTNLSSQSAEISSRIAKSDGLLNKIEALLLEEHTLVRRAAMELLCNLIAGSDIVFERYGGGSTSSVNIGKSKLQIVLALSDVDDLPTRLAASGAIATLTSAPSACQALAALQLERHRVFPILAQIIDPSTVHSAHDENRDISTHPGLIHRAIICTRNICINISDKSLRKKLSREANETGLSQALSKFVRGGGGGTDESVLRSAMEALDVMIDK